MQEKIISELKRENRLLLDQVREVQNRFEDKIAELSMVREMGVALLHVRSFERACRIILDVVIKYTVAQNCSIMLLDSEKEQFFLAAATNPEKKNYILEAKRVFSKEEIHYMLQSFEGAAGQALRDRKPILIKDTKTSVYFVPDERTRINIGSLISVPLLVEDEPIGVLNLSHADTDIFESNDIYLFNIISNFVAISIHSTLNYEKLQYSEAKYRVLSENSNDGIAIIRDDVHVYTNPKYREISGYRVDELEKMPLETLLFTDNTGNICPKMRSLRENGSGNRLLDFELLRNGGENVEVEINASPIMHNGKDALIISVRDLGDRRKLERRLQQAEKMEAIGTLAGGVAHDLNNILVGIVSYPELLLLQLPDDSPLRKSVLTIQKSGEKAAATVQDLLTLARRGVSVREVVDMNAVITDYLNSPAHEKLLFHHPDIRIETRLEPDLLNMLGSPVHLFKTAMNLVSNAAEAMPDGGKISLSTKNRYVDTPVRGYDEIEEGDYVVLTIEDSGTGISREDLGKIFEPFYTNKVMGRSGTGLGMAVVWGTVKDHMGYIDVESIEGTGTTFSLYFPVTRESVETECTAPEDYRGNGESILVVDDIEEQRELASGMLVELGYHVHTVSSGEEAVDYMKAGSVDLLVLDMIMDPGIDGLETYKRILEQHPGQKAVIASGIPETERVKEAQRLGAGAYLKKPYLIGKFGSTIRNELDRACPNTDL